MRRAHMNKLTKSRYSIGSFLCMIGGVAVFVMVILVTYSSISRYFFGQAINYMEEVAGLLLMLVAFLSFAHVYNRRGHIRVEIILDFVPKKIRDWLIILNKLMLLFYLFIFVKLTYDFVKMSYAMDCHTADAQLYEVPWMACMPIGGALLAYCVLVSLIEDIAQIIRGNHLEAEQVEVAEEHLKI